MPLRVVALLFLVGFAFPDSRSMGKPPAVESKDRVVVEDHDLLALLTAGQAEKTLPAGVFVRVEADLSTVGAGPNTKKLQETWEFTARHVHRVVIEPNADGVAYRRAESRPFDSQRLCRELLDGRILTIGAEEGAGESFQFIGTDYQLGGRSVEILVNGKSVLWVGESCLFAGYAEKDARAFPALYELLAQQARAAFQ